MAGINPSSDLDRDFVSQDTLESTPRVLEVWELDFGPGFPISGRVEEFNQPTEWLEYQP